MVRFYVLIALVTFSISAHAKLKIAVMDNDFTGYKHAVGKSLPRNTQFSAGSVKVDAASTENLTDGLVHGLTMAEIVSAGLKNKVDFSLYLYEVRGFTNFREAIDDAIKNKVDIILHSMVRDFGSNFDGRGFINAEVNRATKAGILWINAAGNYGKTSYTGNPAKFDDTNGWVNLPGDTNSLPIECAPPKGVKSCSLRLSLSWTSHSDDPKVGTNKDLDIILDDASLKNLTTHIASELRQVPHEPKYAYQSNYPRETIKTTIPRGKYNVRVVNYSRNFAANDTFRIATDSSFIKFEHFDQGENIFNPADNPSVITVGASDSEHSSQSLKLGKPEVKISSEYALPSGEKIGGSSVAAAKAVVTAALELDRSAPGAVSRDGLIAFLNENPNASSDVYAQTEDENIEDENTEDEAPVAIPATETIPAPTIAAAPSSAQDETAVYDDQEEEVVTDSPAPRSEQVPAPSTPSTSPRPMMRPPERQQHRPVLRQAMPPQQAMRRPRPRPNADTRWLGFDLTGPGCFERFKIPPPDPYIAEILYIGGRAVQTTDDPKIAVAFDPIQLRPGLRRTRADDMILATPRGIIVHPRQRMNTLPSDWAEIFQLPPGTQVCPRFRRQI